MGMLPFLSLLLMPTMLEECGPQLAFSIQPAIIITDCEF